MINRRAREAGTDAAEIARHLNSKGIMTRTGQPFDPYDNAVILGEQRAGLVKYAVIDTSQRSSTRGRHSRTDTRIGKATGVLSRAAFRAQRLPEG